MLVSVRLFAGLRERAGRGELELELPEGATAGAALDALAGVAELSGALDRSSVAMAVNREYVRGDRTLSDGDELALIPPVSGGAGADVEARVTDEPLDPERLSIAVRRPGAGAVVTFQGTTRDVDRLEYEAYGEMARERMLAILEDCRRRHGLEAAMAEHRVGSVPLSEPSVVVAVSAAHRGEAFAGAREAIDRIKAQAPIWKREVAGERSEWVQGAPVHAEDADRLGREEEPASLTHLDGDGRARMVDVGAKRPTDRRAIARCVVRMSPQTAEAVARGDAPKGDVLATARIAGIQAAKRTAELVPLCHPLPLSFVDVRAQVDAAAGTVELEAEARTVAPTGVEMEAMCACSVAALTVYDMVKGLERGVTIATVELVEKTGGRHDWRRNRPPAAAPER